MKFYMVLKFSIILLLEMNHKFDPLDIKPLIVNNRITKMSCE